MPRIQLQTDMPGRAGRLLAIGLAVLATAGTAARASIPQTDLGFLYSRDETITGEDRRRLLGPFVERQTNPQEQTFFALRPLYSSTFDRTAERRLQEIVWPLCSVRRLEDDVSWHVLILYGNTFDAEDPDSRYRTVLFPLLFWGRDKHGEGYFALFPIGGRLNEYLSQDRITFALFPLYMRLEKDERTGTHVLWPLFSRTTGPDVRALRAFPFYGRSSKDGEWTKSFVLWPLWTHTRFGESQGGGEGWLLFPLIGRVATDTRTAWTVLPPLFRWSDTPNQRQWACPWPLLQYSRGRVDKLYVWPLWGRKSSGNSRYSFLLWPVFSWQNSLHPSGQVKRFRAVPLVHYESLSYPQATPEMPPRSRYFKLWPVFSYRRVEDSSRARVLDFWPGKQSQPVERNLAPLWTLYSRTRTAESLDDELLWGLYRHNRRTDGARRWSLFPLFSWRRSAQPEDGAGWDLLMGLLGYDHRDSRRSLRLLYFLRFGGNQESEQ